MRDLFITLPDRLKLAWRAVRGWWTALILRCIDRYLYAQGQERSYPVLDFEELEVLYEAPLSFGDIREMRWSFDEIGEVLDNDDGG